MIKVKKLKIGWLIPYSGIFRNLKADLQQGFDTALADKRTGISIDSCSEYIRSGGSKDTEEALKKLLQYEQVDLVIGVMSNKTALNLVPLLESRQTPAFLLNLGADIPTRQLSSDWLFYNSLHLWKSEWVMGKWAQEKYGGEPSINTSIYEGGYSLHEAFRAGTSLAGAPTVMLNIVKNFTAPYDTLPLIEYIREQSPQHAHALLSGKEGDQFLELFQEHRLTPALTVNPFMVEDGNSVDLPACLDLYNASTWSLKLDRPANHSFVDNYMSDYGEPPNAFSLLAYEAGLALAETLAAIRNQDRSTLAAGLTQTTPEGPRGLVNLSTRPLHTDLPVYIRLPVRSSETGRPENRILESATGIEWNDPSLAAVQLSLTGWQNPYLCV